MKPASVSSRSGLDRFRSWLSVFGLVLLSGAARADFVAYNDCVWSNTEPTFRISTNGIGSGTIKSNGFLVDYNTGVTQAANFGFSSKSGFTPSYSTGAGDVKCSNGTPAYVVFFGKVGLAGNQGGSTTDNGWWVSINFSNLSPSKVYTFVTTANRARPDFTNWWTMYYLTNLLTCYNAITTTTNLGTGYGQISAQSSNSVSFNTGSNSWWGLVAQWTNIWVGADGRLIAVTKNENLNGHNAVGTSGGYGFGAFMLQEETPIALTNPTSSASWPFGSNLTLQATTAGFITNVVFYDGNTPLFTNASAPYSNSWAGVSVGAHSLTAVAYNNLGTAVTSAVVAITVTNGPPTGAIPSPASGAGFSSGASMNIQVTASDTTGNVTNVVIYDGATPLITNTSPPYNYLWTAASDGSHSLKAVATDNGNPSLSATSAAVNISVGLPLTATLSTPAANISLGAGSTCTLSASASGPNPITNLIIYTNSAAYATNPTVGTSVSLSTNLMDVYAGTYQIWARALDNAGAATNSTTNTLTVTNVNIVASFTSPTGSATNNLVGENFTLTVAASGGRASVRSSSSPTASPTAP
jgi:hypothetical protein